MADFNGRSIRCTRPGRPRPFQADSFGKLLEAISAPTLVVAGERGLRLQDEEERMAKIKQHRFVEIPTWDT